MIISTDDLRTLFQEKPVQLLDVRLAEDFDAAHLPGATNNCVFEVAFPGRLADTAPDLGAPTIVYGSNADSHESRMAVEKLKRLGYTNAYDYREGLQGWQAAGHSTEEGPPLPPAPSIENGTHQLDLRESRVEWTGRNLLNKHTGTIAIKSGTLDFQDGTLTGGELVLDMNRIDCTDLEGPMHDLLIAHLRNDDFFDTEHHPEARFEITGSAPLPPTHPGAPNLHVTGTLTLRGITEPLEADLTSGLTPDGKAAAQAAFSIDRTRWGVLYGSGKLFTRLAGHLVNDHIDLQLRLLTE